MFSAEPTETTFRTSDALDLTGAPVFKLVASDAGLIERLTAADVTGKVVIVELDLKRTASLRAANAKLRQWKPALRILVDAKGVMESGAAQRLVDPEQAETSGPQVVLKGRAAAEFYGSLKPGLSGAVATVHIEAPERKLVTLHNVVGVLRGADPALRDTCVLLTAHYDHIGMRPDGQGDRIYNGANDDGSGTVSVLEVARALAAMNPRPRRSIVFVTFFGEEEGLVGSRYYARHPAWPLAKTAAQLNLEQVGRTDSSEGKQISNASLTGFDFSSLTRFVQRAGELTGIKIYKNGQDSDAYFTQSDNLPIAEVGVPAETLTVAFDFPDYHRPGDEWQKIDYGNMAKVDRAIALSLVIMADSDEAPAWNADNPKTAPYVKAWRERHP